MSKMRAILNPACVAVVGASNDPAKLTGRPIAFLQKHGYAGAIYPVNPRYEEIAGLRSYANVADLPEAPDLGLVLVGAHRVVEAVRDLAARGTKAAIVLASGFGEAGADGRERQEQLREAAGGMRILGPNTIGAVNLTEGIPLTASGAMEVEDLPAGKIALLSQSGGILGSLLSRAVARGIGFSKLVATGNEADLEVSDFLEALAEDDETKVVALYLETIRDVRKFRSAATKATAAGKSIVAYKVGRSESGARSAVSHTGALAGADEVYDALFKQLGIIRARTFADLLDIPAALAQGRAMTSNRVAIVTSTGGAATVVADNVGLLGLEVPAPDTETAGKLIELELKEAELDRNPIDVTLAGLRPDLFRAVLRILVESPSYDAIVVVVGSSSIAQPDLVAQPVLETLALTDKPILAYVSPDAPGIIRQLNARGIPAFAAPESCASALHSLAAPRDGRNESASNAKNIDCSDVPAGTLNEADAKKVFARFGISVTREVTAETPDAAAKAAGDFGGRVAIKILSNEILHKSEMGGVVLNVDPADVGRECAAMMARVRAATSAKIDGFLVQEMVTGGVELILGYNRDPQLGAYVLLGAGGVTTELYNDVAIRLLPLDRASARDMIDEIKAGALLRGFRGKPKADIEALIDAMIAFSAMAETLDSRLSEAEINPVFVLPEGQGAWAGDSLIVLD
ncbi:acetate--CoA ligase family protein [Nisaea sediminum]|uniref:acetate--CoA ligase family protein n=1 Tax=Nisaea sediminum TaxID=2775867 RepID=UPI0018692398|nr:acetate--CoA ligase family protein [Nisaea sediminum]